MFNLYDVESFYTHIPTNARVCIWGAANAGISIKEELSKFRTDVEITSFIDSRKKGKIDNVPIYAPQELSAIKDTFNFMIVSTRSDCTIIDAALFYHDIDYIRIPQNLLKLYQFIPSKIETVLNFLDTKSDKDLFLKLLKARITNNTDEIKQYVLDTHNITPDRKRTIKHYTSYINYDAIETIIEGGMFNGLNTVIFKKLFKNLKQVYAFELIYDDVKNPILDPIIQAMSELEIIPLALWDKKTKLEFTENIAKPYSSGINPTYNRNDSEKTFTVDTVSIDEYVQEHHLNKIDFIKMDIEGAETKALMGAKNSLVKYRPQLAVSIYHSNNDMLDIPIYLNNLLKDYVFKIGQYSPDNDETILYAIPKELHKQ